MIRCRFIVSLNHSLFHSEPKMRLHYATRILFEYGGTQMHRSPAFVTCFEGRCERAFEDIERCCLISVNASAVRRLSTTGLCACDVNRAIPLASLAKLDDTSAPPSNRVLIMHVTIHSTCDVVAFGLKSDFQNINHSTFSTHWRRFLRHRLD